MTPRPVAHYLTAFDAPLSSEPDDANRITGDERGGETPTIEHDLILVADGAPEDGRAEWAAAESGKLERAVEEAIESERLAIATRIASERAGWAQDEGAKLGEALGAALAEIEAGIAARVAGVLRPFISMKLRDSAVDELTNTLNVLLRGRDQPIIEISGAPDLIAALQGRLAGATAAIVWMADCSSDVRIIADQTVIRSRIEAWMREIDAGVAAAEVEASST